MAEKRDVPKKRSDKRSEDEVKPVGGPWPDPEAREQMSQGDARRDAGKHSKNPDWEKKW
jgi:hypothetical protein